MKVVIVGSCRFEPYDILAVPNKIANAWNTEKGYKKAAEKFYPAIDSCDEVWIYAPDGIGEHTLRDIEYAQKKGKRIKILKVYPPWDGNPDSAP
jgi:hypothetical protein